MGLTDNLKCKALRWALPLPFESVHHAYSTIYYVDEKPTDRLLDLSVKIIQEARGIDLGWLATRMKIEPHLARAWPGQHYRALAALVKIIQPKRVVEIGTFSGVSALAMKAFMPAGSELITVDIIPWNRIEETVLTEADFQDGRLRQVIGDLSEQKFFGDFSETLEGCDLLFVDGPKNVTFEEAFLKRLSCLKMAKNPVVIFDDIKLWNMLKIWHGITRPKLDFTSFGHYTGTGIVDWNG